MVVLLNEQGTRKREVGEMSSWWAKWGHFKGDFDFDFSIYPIPNNQHLTFLLGMSTQHPR